MCDDEITFDLRVELADEPLCSLGRQAPVYKDREASVLEGGQRWSPVVAVAWDAILRVHRTGPSRILRAAQPVIKTGRPPIAPPAARFKLVDISSPSGVFGSEARPTIPRPRPTWRG